MRKFGLFFLLVIGGCSSEECAPFRFLSQFDYEVNPTLVTPKGIEVDLSGQSISLEDIDRKVAEVEDCLAKTFSGGQIPEEDFASGQCQKKTFNPHVCRDCLVVKIPNDWELSCNNNPQTNQPFQLLPLSHTTYDPTPGCIAKGLMPTPECPCRWRAGLQDNHIIVATPDLYNFKDPLIRYITGCNGFWYDEKLAACWHSGQP